VTDNEPPTDGTEDRRLATIRALLAKAEATEYPQEAEAFFAKASELISRWAVDEALLWAGQGDSRERPDELQLVVHAPYLPQKAVLVGSVATAHGCRAVRLLAGRGHRAEVISVVGFPAELRWVEALVTSLLLQLTSAMLAASPDGMTPAETASWRRSFIIGFAEEVGVRLERDRRSAADERDRPRDAAAATPADGSTALVLASRAEEVDRDFRRRHPTIRSSWASSGRSSTGRRAGRAAGREASLARHGLTGRRSIGSGRGGRRRP
jgi:hypothetical protein